MTNNSSSLTRSQSQARGLLQRWADLSLSKKLVTILIGTTIIAVVVFGSLILYTFYVNLNTQIKSEQMVNARSKVTHVDAFLTGAQSDVIFLSQSPTLVHYLTQLEAGVSPDDLIDARATIEAEFLAFAQARVFYAQVRFIDNTGQEIVRVDTSSDGVSTIITQANLQNKGDRYYFENSVGIPPGEVYISPLDLNVEQGQIEIPHKPVIRYGTPVYFNGRSRGIIITNVLAENFLTPLGDDQVPAFLVDAGGYYLYHPDQEKRWGSDLETGISLARDFPQLFPALVSGRSDTIVVDETFFAFIPVKLPGERLPRWYLANYVSRSVAFAPLIQTAYIGLALLAVTILIAAAAALFLDRTVARPLVDLTYVAEKVAAGDMAARAQIVSSDEIGVLSSTLNVMAERTGVLLQSLETRAHELEARTREIEASQRVTFAASERTSPDGLLSLVVNLMRDQFHLYHVQVYIVDEEEQAAVLRQSTGYAGRRLLQGKHRILLDQPALVTKAIHEGEPAVVADTGADPDFMPNPLLPDTLSELVVPLKTGDRVIGALDAQDRAIGRFTPNIVTLFQSMADQVTFLFENSDLVERVTEHSAALTIFTDQLRTAADIARRLGGTLDPERLLQQVVELIRSRFGFYHVHIYMLDVATGRLIVQAGSGEVGRVLRERGHFILLDAKKSLVARAARARETVLVEDTTLESDFMPNPLLPQTRSSMSIPLVAGDKTLGVLNIQDDQPNRFTQADRDTFDTLAGQIATALQTAGLFGQIQAGFRVSQALAGAQTEEDVADAIMLVAGFRPQARVSMYTFDQDGNGRTAVVRRDEAFDSDTVSMNPVGTRLEASQFPLFQLVSADEPFVSHNLPRDERVGPDNHAMADRVGIASIAALPITAGDEWLGMLVASSKEEGFFNERRLYLYQSLAEQGAIALRTARLFDETQRAAEELRAMDRLKNEFLANMSHELRTPLNSIIGYTEIMLMGIDGEMDPDTHEDVQAIHTNGRHLLSMINDILDMAKIEAGRLALNLEENHVDSLIEDASIVATKLVADKPIGLIVEVDDDLPPIQGDRMRLDQIFKNLVTNAVKFTEQGTITLRAYVDRSGRGDRDWVCVDIEDTGLGIAEGDVEMIFDRFQQVDGSSTRSAGGTGMGLAITQNLVHLHGGVIEVKSKLGEGSTFTVRLPVKANK
ncbi:MAG: GAF domain-containing protein [Chloroflexi bacterium]|nr:GAF domain-containing protein [Chloroflexota bacterium]